MRESSWRRVQAQCEWATLEDFRLGSGVDRGDLLVSLGWNLLDWWLLRGGLGLGLGLGVFSLCLGLEDGNCVGKGVGSASAAGGVPSVHNLDLDTENTLLHQDVADGLVDKVADGLTGVDHESVGELHRLGTRGTQLARDDDFATLSTGLHDESEHTVSGTSDSQTGEELVSQRLALGDGVETTVLHLLGVELERSLGELESLLNKRRQLANAAALLAKDLLGVGGSDDDFSPGVSDTDFAARVSLFGKFTSEELVELGGKDTVSHELGSEASAKAQMNELPLNAQHPIDVAQFLTRPPSLFPSSLGSSMVVSSSASTSKACIAATSVLCAFFPSRFYHLSGCFLVTPSNRTPLPLILPSVERLLQRCVFTFLFLEMLTLDMLGDWGRN